MRLFKKLLIITGILLIANAAFGQSQYWKNPKYGKDSVERVTYVKNKSIYREFLKNKNYKDAYQPWRWIYNNVPAASKNTYLDGVKIYKWFIKKEKDATKKQLYVDTLMMVYDTRVKYFKKEGYVLGRKAVDLLKYRPEAVEDAYAMVNRSIELRKKRTDYTVLYWKVKLAESLFKDGKKGADEVLNAYAIASEIADYNIANNPKKKASYQSTKENFEKIFTDSDAASCENLIALYTPKFEAEPTNAELLEKITTILSDRECKDSELFAKASENLYKVSPTPKAAYMLAELFKSKGEYAKAKKYYLEASNNETNLEDKSNMLVALSYLMNGNIKSPQEAVKYAKQAISANPKNGNAYMILGLSYASIQKYGPNDLTAKAVYWIAVDNFVKAKRVDPTLAEKANNYIKVYSQYFIENKRAFFYDLQDGQTYKFDGWIKESTTVRIKK
jgi:tetratricopeptide (TPR) repeat protein